MAVNNKRLLAAQRRFRAVEKAATLAAKSKFVWEGIVKRRGLAMLAAAAASVIVPILVLAIDTANAQSSGRGSANVRGGRGGYCPAGTCNVSGGRFANNLANCKASNCK